MIFVIRSNLFIVLLILRYAYVDLLEVDVHIPDNVAAGESVTLCCYFNSKIEDIYSVKWYRGNREIYRYMPSENPAVKAFPFDVGGLEVDILRSNHKCVTLKNVSILLTGQFTCEVTAGENMTTVAAFSNLYIYDPIVFVKPTIKYDQSTQLISCSAVRILHSSKKFSTAVYCDSDKVDQKYVTYDELNNMIVLNILHLLDWNNIKSKSFHCEVDLPGTSPISSDEIQIDNYSNNGFVIMCSTQIICMSWIFIIFL